MSECVCIVYVSCLYICLYLQCLLKAKIYKHIRKISCEISHQRITTTKLHPTNGHAHTQSATAFPWANHKQWTGFSHAHCMTTCGFDLTCYWMQQQKAGTSRQKRGIVSSDTNCSQTGITVIDVHHSAGAEPPTSRLVTNAVNRWTSRRPVGCLSYQTV